MRGRAVGSAARGDSAAAARRSRRQFVRGMAELGLSAAGLALLGGCGPLSPPGAPSARISRVGYLQPGSLAPAPYLEALRQGLRHLGYAEGSNLALELRIAQAGGADLPALAAELVRLAVDLILAVSPAAAQAARSATGTIPIVAVGLGSDSVAQGLIASLGRPGGNVTGLLLDLPALCGKQLELLMEALPTVSRVAVLWNPTRPDHGAAWRVLESAARGFAVQLQPLAVHGPDELEGLFETATRQGADALLMLHDPLAFAHRAYVVELARRHRLPTMHEFREWAQTGALLAYGPSLLDSYRRAAVYVDRILRGAKPGDLPVEQPMQPKLVINLQTARALGVTIPPAVLREADNVIQ